ncbi:autotransporter domain-containing protein, partial [Candidatus Proelusimicrobium excrementi]|uniref:autotransporter domain-containing protein n=1 Tax=Candidatus Proelusimicrobium excrementi TaxID=3416222 RepID=UPI003C8B0646|nr:autotransporter domain-containing protein [Elusimicrobiaceae bacterium]
MGVQDVTGGTAEGTIIGGFGTQTVAAGGSAVSAVINAGGLQNVSSGGTVNDTQANASAVQNIMGGVANSTALNSGAVQNITAGGTARNTEAAGAVQNVIRGIAINTNLNEGAAQNVSSGGVTSHTYVNSGAVQNVYEGGTAVSTAVSGGVQNIAGLASGALIAQGGVQNILAGGYAEDVTAASGGTQNINVSASAKNVYADGGTVNLLSGGSLQGYSAQGGLLNVYGDNHISGDMVLSAGAAVNIAQDSAGFTNLSADNIQADNALIKMNVNLETGESDRLTVNGNYEGQTVLALSNTADVAKETTGDGIKLVEFSSGAQVDGDFELLGGKWDEGGYEYLLHQGTAAGVGSDYYLRNSMVYTDVFKSMLNIPLMNSVIARSGMNSLQKRMGDLRNMTEGSNQNGIWARTYYKDMRVKDLVETDMSLFGVEAGYDWLFTPNEPTKLYAGVMIGYANAGSIKTEKENGSVYGDGKGTSPSVGIYATLANDDKWFVDLAARNFWTKLDMTHYSASGSQLKFEPERSIFAVSLEGGKEFTQDLGGDSFIRIEPKAEIEYMSASSDETKVKGGTGPLAYDKANYLSAKGAVMVAYSMRQANGLLIEPLLELAYRYEFMGEGDVSYGGAKETTSLKGGTLEAGLGINMQLTENLYWHAVGSYEAGDKLQGWGVNAGIRYAFGGISFGGGSKNRKKARKESFYEYNKYDRGYYDRDYDEKPKKEKQKKVKKTKKNDKTYENKTDSNEIRNVRRRYEF